ncbi:MAG: class I SAM-dependent methyltransferase [Firmicutes bacterium]|nr:class I SAM-dependent methyltransferase [Bacillota bacterium]
MSEFRYSDRGDVLTGQLIAGGYDSAYWGKSEEKVLDRALEYIKNKFGEEMLPYLSVLDLGCGCGRPMPRFSALFSSVTGLEPDAERCDQAMELILDQGLENATALCMDLQQYAAEFPNQTFDVVLCSHVFQHMKHETACAILEGLKHVMGPDTVCIFTTTFTDRRRNLYTEEFLENGERTVLETDETGFDRAVDDPDKLAVCLFSRPWMERFLTSCGLKTQLFQAYHFAGERRAEDDISSSGDPAELAFARDAFYLCEPAEGTLLRTSCGPETASGKICYMQFYYVDANESMNTARIRKFQTTEKDDVAEIREAFATAEGFLYGGTLHFPAIRYFRIVDVRSDKVDIAESHLIISFYPRSGAVQVSVNLTLQDISCDDFIFLHQVQCADGFFTINGKPGSIGALCESVLAECGLRHFIKGSNSIITELNRYGSCKDPLSLTLDEERCLYGMLTGDEGYLHVPQALIEERMAESWTSRDFVKVIAFSSNYVLLNFNQGETYADYIDYQKPYADHYFGALNEYFTMDAPTAGVNHGLFFSVEMGQIIRTSTERLMSGNPKVAASHGFFVTDDIKRNKRIRAEMIRTLNKLDRVNITELGALDDLVLKNLDASQKIESIRNFLELVESDLDLLYSTTTNRMVTILTILGLLFALIQTINSFQ